MGASNANNPVQSVLHPIATVMDLEDIGADDLRDYFLYHPYDGELENIYLSAPDAVQLSNFSIQIVQKRGSTIVVESAERPITELAVNATALSVPGSFGEGAVFARVRSAAVPGQKLFITLHVRTNEVT